MNLSLIKVSYESKDLNNLSTIQSYSKHRYNNVLIESNENSTNQNVRATDWSIKTGMEKSTNCVVDLVIISL
jgi:hypothetical protein